jgi:dipeptidyl aminopeptidase/acylaminoacyl peptidase
MALKTPSFWFPVELAFRVTQSGNPAPPGEKFTQAIKLDPLKTPGEELNQAVDEAIQRYPFIDGTRVCATGASYGGGPAWDGNPIWREQSAIIYAANWKTPMLLSIGERDFRVPIGNTLENWSTLQRMHVPSRLLVWPDAWHWIQKAEDSRHSYDEAHRWLATRLKGETSTDRAPGLSNE